MEDDEETRRLSDGARTPKLTDSLGEYIKRFGMASYLLRGIRSVSGIEKEKDEWKSGGKTGSGTHMLEVEQKGGR